MRPWPPAAPTTNSPTMRIPGESSDIGRDLYKVRNVKPLWSRYGLVVGVGLGGFDMWTNELFKSSIFGTLKHGKPDSDTLKPLSEATPIAIPQAGWGANI